MINLLTDIGKFLEHMSEDSKGYVEDEDMPPKLQMTREQKHVHTVESEKVTDKGKMDMVKSF